MVWVYQHYSGVLLNPPTTDHRSLTTDHNPLTTDHSPTNPLTTSLPTHQVYFKDSITEKYSFYRIQTQLEKYKTILWSI